MRIALRNELDGRDERVNDIATCIALRSRTNRSRPVPQTVRAQALLAVIDTLVKTLFTCVPEPLPGEWRNPLRERATATCTSRAAGPALYARTVEQRAATTVLQRLLADAATPAPSRIRAALGLLALSRDALNMKVEARLTALEAT